MVSLLVAGPALVVPQAALAACVLTFTPATLPAGQVGVLYSQTFSAPAGGCNDQDPPLTFSETGTLPPGLSFAGAKLTGTPTLIGTFPSFDVTVSDTRVVTPRTTVLHYVLTVAIGPTTTSLSALTPAMVGQTATFTATIAPPSATGTVTFDDAGTAISTAVAVAAGWRPSPPLR